MKDDFGNELGVNADGTTTFNGQTMAEYVASGALPAGYYQDPEGTIRQKMGTVDANGQFIGFTGDKPNMGSTHGIAHFEDGQIVSFSGGGAAIPPGETGPGGAHPQPPYNPQSGPAAAFDLKSRIDGLLEQLIALASR